MLHRPTHAEGCELLAVAVNGDLANTNRSKEKVPKDLNPKPKAPQRVGGVGTGFSMLLAPKAQDPPAQNKALPSS